MWLTPEKKGQSPWENKNQTEAVAKPEFSIDQLIDQSVGFAFIEGKLVLYLGGHHGSEEFPNYVSSAINIGGHQGKETELIIDSDKITWLDYTNLASYHMTPENNKDVTAYYFPNLESELSLDQIPKPSNGGILKLTEVNNTPAIVFSRN